MKAPAVGALVVTVLGGLTVFGWAENRPVAGLPVTGSSELIALTTALGESRQQLTLIDPKTRTLGVYHVDGATGEISLKSVRNFHWDLQLSHFNNTGPTPPDIRSLVEPR